MDSRSSYFSPLVMTEISFSSDSLRPINNRSVLVIIIVSDNYELKKFNSGSLERETSFYEFSFDALLFYDFI